MVICHATDVFNKYTQLNKRTVIETFKRVAQGKKEVQFETFYEILTKLG